MLDSIKYKEIYEITKEKLSSISHGIDHVIRVYKMCLSLKEGLEVDMDVLEAAALLHDIGNIYEQEDNSGKIDHSVIGAEMVYNILYNIEDFPNNKIQHVKDCIITHRFKSDNQPKSIEAMILFDADKLDALGTIGIARAFMFSGKYNQQLYKDIDIDEYRKENMIGKRIKDVSKHSPNIEFETKLKKIQDRLFTDKAKKIAINKIKYMENFFYKLRDEILKEEEISYRYRVKEGDIVRYKGKKYVIIGWDIVCGGNCKQVYMIKLYNDEDFAYKLTCLSSLIRVIKIIRDDQIDECELLN